MGEKQNECAVQNGAHFRTDKYAEGLSRRGWGEGKREEVGGEEEREEMEEKEENEMIRDRRGQENSQILYIAAGRIPPNTLT